MAEGISRGRSDWGHIMAPILPTPPEKPQNTQQEQQRQAIVYEIVVGEPLPYFDPTVSVRLLPVSREVAQRLGRLGLRY